jgi:hypothetical protein
MVSTPLPQVNLDGERQVLSWASFSGVPGVASGRSAVRPATARRPTIRFGRGRCASGGSGGVAGDLAVVYDALAQSRRETERIKDALRRWQSEQARARNERSHGR